MIVDTIFDSVIHALRSGTRSKSAVLAVSHSAAQAPHGKEPEDGGQVDVPAKRSLL